MGEVVDFAEKKRAMEINPLVELLRNNSLLLYGGVSSAVVAGVVLLVMKMLIAHTNNVHKEIDICLRAKASRSQVNIYDFLNDENLSMEAVADCVEGQGHSMDDFEGLVVTGGISTDIENCLGWKGANAECADYEKCFPSESYVPLGRFYEAMRGANAKFVVPRARIHSDVKRCLVRRYGDG